MSISTILFGIKLAAKRTFHFCAKHSPQIMVGLGIGGFVGTAVASGKAALKAKDILDEKDQQLALIEGERSNPEYKEEKYIQDKKTVNIQTAWKLVKTFAPPVTLGAASTLLVLGGHHILGRRAAAALASAYEAQKKLYKYDENVTNLLGEETAKKLREGLEIDKLNTAEELRKTDEAAKGKPVEKKKGRPRGETVDFLFCEESCGARYNGHGWWCDDAETNIIKLKQLRNQAQDYLMTRTVCTLNDILVDIFDTDPIEAGKNVVYTFDEKYGYDKINIGIRYAEDEPGYDFTDILRACNPNIWLHFNVPHHADEVNYDDILKRKHGGSVRKHYYISGK